MIDLTTRKVVYERDFDQSITVRIMGYDTRTERVTAAVHDVLRPFDCEKREFAALLARPWQLHRRHARRRHALLRQR